MYDDKAVNTAQQEIAAKAQFPEFVFGPYQPDGRTAIENTNKVQGGILALMEERITQAELEEEVARFDEFANSKTGKARTLLLAYSKAVKAMLVKGPNATAAPTGGPDIGDTDKGNLDMTGSKSPGRKPKKKPAPKKKKGGKVMSVLLAVVGLFALSVTTKAQKQLDVSLMNYTVQQTYCVENVLGRYHGRLVEFVWQTQNCVPRVKNPRIPRNRTFIRVEDVVRRNVLDQGDIVVINPVGEPAVGKPLRLGTRFRQIAPGLKVREVHNVWVQPPPVKYAHAQQKPAAGIFPPPPAIIPLPAEESAQLKALDEEVSKQFKALQDTADKLRADYQLGRELIVRHAAIRVALPVTQFDTMIVEPDGKGGYRWAPRKPEPTTTVSPKPEIKPETPKAN